MNTIQDVRECFNLKTFLKARELTISAVKQFREKVFIGMTEDDGHQIIDEILQNMGAEKKWHPNKFRIGKNTIKSFRDESDKRITLSDEDIFFIDIGPVWDNHEGDYGDTYCLGDNKNYIEIADACRDVFSQTASAWKSENLSGEKLYKFAESYAHSLGFNLNKKMESHRVGDFPHHLFYKGGMLEMNEIPCDNLWVLEIHLISKDGQYGSFFEDILKR